MPSARTVLNYSPITGRAILLGLLGVFQVALLQVATIAQPSLVVPPWTSGPYLSWYAILPGVVFYLFLIAVVNTALKRWLPRFALRPSEFALIYGMTTVGGAISAMDEATNVFPTYLFPFRATQLEATEPYRVFIPPWFVPQNPAIVEPYYSGNTNFWTVERLLAWGVPLLTWTMYFLALGAAMWATNILLRRRWLEHDRLAMPNVQLPLAMCQSSGFGGVLSGRLFWGGFGAAVLIETYLCLQPSFPQLPEIPVFISLNGILSGLSRPWDGLFPMVLAASVLHFGVCYFIPTDILLSGWFFYLFRKGLEVLGRAMGWNEVSWDPTGFPFPRALSAGTWITLFFLLFWQERRHFMQVLDAVFSTGRKTATAFSDENEFASYQIAGRVLIFSVLFLFVFTVAAGMSPLLALVYLTFFGMVQVTITRVYCQVGPPILDFYFLDLPKTLTSVLGTSLMDNGSLTHLALSQWLTRTNSGHPMAHLMAAFYVAQNTDVERRGMGRWVLVAFVVGAIVCLLTYLHLAYGIGEDLWRQGGWRECDVQASLGRLREWDTMPKGPAWDQIGFMLVGAGITLTLWKAIYTFLGFPFHPLGFGLAMCHGVEFTWLAFLFTWLVKFMILRWGGLPLYHRFIPLFLGIVLGGLVTPAFWSLVAWAVGWNRLS